MTLELIDTHCHLTYDPLGSSVETVLARARHAGVAQCISIGTDVESSRAVVALAQREPMVWAAVGIHPNDATTATAEAVRAIDELAGEAKVVAIGEVGLDDYRHHAPLDVQQRALRAFLEIARRRHLPLLIHCRNAYEPLLSILRGYPAPWRGLMHCASGPPEFIQAAVAMGFHISFAGNVTFPNAHALRALVPLVPDDRLLVETDAPFLAPQPVRGQPNEPAYVAHTAAALAQLRGITLEAVGAMTTRNAQRLFALPETPPRSPA